MKDSSCTKCGRSVDTAETFDGICSDCFIRMAQSRKPLERGDRDRLKAAVKEELEGILPREALRELFEDGYARLLEGKVEFDDEIGRLVNATERMAGLAIAKEVLTALEGMKRAVSGSLDVEIEELRSKVRRIASL